MNKNRTRVPELLAELRRTFPLRKQKFDASTRQMCISNVLNLEICAPTIYDCIPTFDLEICKQPSPMISDRYEYAGSWLEGPSLWPSVIQMQSWMEREDIVSSHMDRREYWDNSAPMLFADNELTLFGVSPSLPEDAEYFVWHDNKVEPEVWIYSGLETQRFSHLEAYLRWRLQG